MGAELESPLWLVSLPLLAALLVWTRLDWWRAAFAHRTGGLWRKEARRLALRLAWSTLVVLALAGLTVVRPLDRQATMLVLDVSASMTTVRDQVDSAARAGAAALRQGDVLGIVATADGASVEEAPTDRPLFLHMESVLPDQRSDLSAGIRLAGAVLPRDFSRRVVVVSDGRQTGGDAIGAARELAAIGTAVDVLPVGQASGADVRLESVEVARTAYQGEVPALTARVSSDRPTAATIRVWRDDGELAVERGVQLATGQQELALSLPAAQDPGFHRYRVDVDVADRTADATPLNDSLGAVQSVLGPPRVLVLANDAQTAAPLVGALQAGGAEVRVAQPSAAPTDLAGWSAFQAVILDDVSAESLPASAADQLESYVRDLGRGLAMIGGPNSFGAGGFSATGIERALPVYMDVRGRGRQPRVALALVIDKSGSMEGPKIDMAKEAAVRSLKLLGPLDQALVLTFDTVVQWVASPTPVTDHGRQQLDDAIGSIDAGGGTEIFPAVELAFEALRDADADVKHLILLTDGQDAGRNNYQPLVDQMRAAHVTASTVAVGNDADQAFLSALARAGRGRFHYTDDPADIPEIFTRETLMATRALLVDTHFFPSVASTEVGENSLLRGLSTTPALDGYIAVTPKERAEVVLVSPDSDPLLAAWQYGAGRAVAWTSDVGGRWTTGWVGTPTAATLWGNILSWLLPSQTQGPLAVNIEPSSTGQAFVTADVGQNTDSDWAHVKPTRARVVGPDGRAQEVELAPAGPGRYRGTIDAALPGAYVAEVTQDIDSSSASGATLNGEAGWVAPYPAEFRETGVDRLFLQQIAAAGGGRVLDTAADATRPAEHPTAARWPAWPLLVVFAGVLWPLEIASRRFSAPAPLPALVSRVRTFAPARRRADTDEPPPVTTADHLLARKRSRRDRPSR